MSRCCGGECTCVVAGDGTTTTVSGTGSPANPFTVTTTDSPALGSNATAVTQPRGNDSTKIATTEFVHNSLDYAIYAMDFGVIADGVADDTASFNAAVAATAALKEAISSATPLRDHAEVHSSRLA